MTTIKLSGPQAALLGDILDTGLYIRKYGRYQRTVESLERMGLVRCDEPDYSRLGNHHWVATDDALEKLGREVTESEYGVWGEGPSGLEWKLLHVSHQGIVFHGCPWCAEREAGDSDIDRYFEALASFEGGRK